MTISFVAATSSTTGTTTRTATVPAGIEADDILLLSAAATATVGTASISQGGTGWALVYSGIVQPVAGVYRLLYVWWKRTTGSESNVTVTGTSTVNLGVTMSAWRGCVSSGDPVDVHSATLSTGSTATPTCAAISTTTENTMVVMHGMAGGGTYTATSPSGPVTDINLNITGTPQEFIISDIRAATGSTGTESWSWSDAGAHTYAAGMLALVPEGAPTGEGIAYVNSAATEGALSTPSFAATAHNLIVAYVLCDASLTVNSVTDTAGNSYTNTGVSSTDTSASPNSKVSVFYAKNISANASNVVTANLSGSSTWNAVMALQYSGVHLATPYDTGNGHFNTPSSTSIHSGSFTPAAAGELTVAGGVASFGATTWTNGSGYTFRRAGSVLLNVEDDVSCSGGSQTSTATIGTASEVPWVTVVFRPLPITWFSASLPGSHLRRRWNPPRGQVARPVRWTPVIPTLPAQAVVLGRPWRQPFRGDSVPFFYSPPPVPAPDMGTVVTPGSFLRPIWDPERSATSLPVGVFRLGPPLEQGWPVSARVEGTAANYFSVTTPATFGPDRLIYATVAWYSGSTAPGPITVSGLGLSWTRVASSTSGPPFVEQEGSEIWAAWANDPIPGGVVTVSFANAGSTYALATVYARYLTAGLGNAADAFGATATAMDMTGSTAVRTVTLAGTDSESGAAVVVVDGSGTAYGATSNTLFDSTDTTIVTMGSGSLTGAPLGGDVTIGMDGTGAYYTIAAAEILPATAITQLPWAFFGPASFMRPHWNPEHSAFAAPPMYLPALVAPLAGMVLGPTSFLRPIWNPGRSAVTLPPPKLAVVVPMNPVMPLLPGAHMRPAWMPPRSQVFQPDVVSHIYPYAVFATPIAGRVNEPFQVRLLVTNPMVGKVYVWRVQPWIEGLGPFTVGTVAPLGRSVIPNRLDAALSAGLIGIGEGETETFFFDCVAFLAGDYHLWATIEFADGSEIEAAEAVISIAPLS